MIELAINAGSFFIQTRYSPPPRHHRVSHTNHEHKARSVFSPPFPSRALPFPPLFPSNERLKAKGEGGKDNPPWQYAKPRCFACHPCVRGSVSAVSVHSWSAARCRGVPLRTPAVTPREGRTLAFFVLHILFRTLAKRDSAACAPPCRTQSVAKATDCEAVKSSGIFSRLSYLINI